MNEYTKKTRYELINICKEQKIKGYSNLKKNQIIKILEKNCVFEMEIEEIKKKDELDKFYTIPTCSKKCIDKICELYEINGR